MINKMSLLLSFPLWVATLALVAAGLYGLRYRAHRLSIAFAASMFLGAIWTTSYALELVSTWLLAKIIWANIQLSLAPFLALMTLITAAEHTQQSRWLNSNVFYVTWLVPVLNLLMVWLPALNNFYRHNYRIAQEGFGGFLAYDIGPWEGMIAAFLFGVVFIALGLYISSLASSKGVYFWQTLFLTIAILIPAISAIWQNLLGNRLFPGYDIVPGMLFFTGMISLYALWRHQWLQIPPIARSQIVDSLQDAILIVDGQGRLLDFNRSAARLLGLGNHMLSQPAEKVVPHWEQISGQLTTDHTARIRLASPLDSVEWEYEILVNEMQEEISKLTSRIIYLRQVTPSLLLQEKLSQLSQIVQQNPLPVVVTNPGGLIEYVNPQFTTLTGYSVEESIGQNINILKSGEVSQETYAELWHEITSGNTWRGELLNRRKDGSLYWEQSTISPIFDEQGKITSYVAIKEDITQRKETEELLRKRFIEISTISDIGLAAASQLELKQLTALVGKSLEESFHARSVLIAITNPKTEMVDIPYWSIKGDRVQASSFKRGEGLTSIVINTKKPLLISHDFQQKSQELGGVLTYVGQYGYPKTWLGVPILAGQEVLGVISIQDYEQEYAYNEDEINALSAIASNVAGAIQNAQLYAETQRELAERKRAEAETSRKAEQLSILYAASRDLSSGLELNKLLQTLRERCHQIVPFNTFGIATYDSTSKTLKYLELHQNGTSFGGHIRNLDENPGLSRKVIQAQTTIYISDTQKYTGERTTPLASQHKDEVGSSYLGIPFIKGGQVTGLMTLQSRQANAFNHEHIQLLETLASQAAAAIENARLFEETRRRADEMSILYELGLDVSSNIRLEEVMHKLMEKCKQLLPMDVFYVGIYDEINHTIHHPLFYDDGVFTQVPTRDIRETPGLSGEIILTRKTLHIPDTLANNAEKKYQIIHAGGKYSRAYLGVPLIIRDKIVGVLSIQSYTPNQYTPEQVRLFETIATQAAIAIENSKLYEKAQDEIDQRRKVQENLEDQLVKVEAMQKKLREQAYRDPLTGLHNRRYLNETLPQKFSLAQKKNTPLSIIMLDVDNFKAFNDTYGHEVGDLLLKQVGDLLRDHTRATDIACRYGGEEFLVGFPDMPIEVAARRAESIRNMFTSKTLNVNGIEISATLSLGVAAFPSHGENPQEVIIQADQALYEAKSLGKNQVVVWSTK